MSENISQTEFETMIDGYLHGELSQQECYVFDRYLADHPEVKLELEKLELVLKTAANKDTNPPAGLLELATAGLNKQLSDVNPTSEKSKPRKKLWRPVFAWSLAASVALVLGLTLWPSGSALVFADVFARLRKVECLHVEGWVRGEDGSRISYRQWLNADGSFRAEVGDNDQQRVVVVNQQGRSIIDHEGRLYHDGKDPQLAGSLERAFLSIQAIYQNPETPQNSFEYAKEDRGDVVRFSRRRIAHLGAGPSNRKSVLDVDKTTALPLSSEMFQLVDGQWLQLSALNYSDLDKPAAAERFSLPGTSLPISVAKKQEFWFEYCISPGSVYMPAVFVPEDGLQLIWPEKLARKDEITSGGWSEIGSGITTHGFLNIGLDSVVRALSNRQVAPSAYGEIPVTLVFSAKTVLPWREKLEPVLDHLELKYEVVSKQTMRKSYVFKFDGRNLPVSDFQFPSYGTTASAGQYQYNFEKTRLKDVISTLFGNCDQGHNSAPGDTVIYYWEKNKGENPFNVEVDLQFTNTDTTWRTNEKMLQEKFGVTCDVEERLHKIYEIQLLKN